MFRQPAAGTTLPGLRGVGRARSSSPMIAIDTLGAVRHLTIDRPEKRNALDLAHYDALADALEQADRDEAISAVVLSGKGPAFCAGVDLAAMGPSGAGPALGVAAERLFTALDSLALPLVAAVDGAATGLGLTMLGYADLVLASPRARFRAPFAALGFAPEAASSVLLPRRIGWQNAAWMLFSTEWIDAPEAREMGLVWRILPEEDFVPNALELAARLAAQPRPALAAAKRLLVNWRSTDASTARRLESEAFATLLGSRRG